MAGASVDVFEFLDYRAFLRAHYAERKANARFSHRAFSRRAGLRSPNYLKLVMDGERNLSAEMAERFAAACGLVGDGADYFERLVAFNQARTDEERNSCYRELKRHARFRLAHGLTLAQDLYHSRWYFPAIRELVASTQFREDPEWIAARLLPPIKATEAKQALATLLELGLIERDPEGRLRRVESTVSTAALRSIHLASYHRAMMGHATTALERLPKPQRDISAVTLCVGPEGFGRLREALRQFRAELLELEVSEEAPCQVVQINFQLFSLSTPDAELPAEADGTSGAAAKSGPLATKR